ncbi:hypothetical protein [Streptomyces tsukubensis]|uniref:hypothetical protein n=1 Tax=Streptomyces tsukubensis TaxID=83656 RepID=UPI00344DFAF2
MSVEIYDSNPGRTISSYDLLDEIAEQHNLDRTAAHEMIHAMLDGLVQDDPSVILGREAEAPARGDNPHDLDVRYWLTVSDETAQLIREAIASTMEHSYQD